MLSFKKNNNAPAAPAEPVNYNTVLDWLVGLSNEDYEKTTKVANIYRNANKEAAKKLGVEPAVTAHIFESAPAETTGGSLFDDDDLMEYEDLEPEYLKDDHETPASRKQRELAEKAVKNASKKK